MRPSYYFCDFSSIRIQAQYENFEISGNSAYSKNESKISLSQLERQYARLKSLIYDRREKLEELVVLTEFRRFLDELERWIREKEIVASSEDTGIYSKWPIFDDQGDSRRITQNDGLTFQKFKQKNLEFLSDRQSADFS